MKLSEAIRLGIPKGGKQIKETYLQHHYSYNEHAGVTLSLNTCALGAAALGAGYDPDKKNAGSIDYFMQKTFPDLKKPWDGLVPDHAFSDSVYNQIALANDSGLTREEIADKLEAAGF